MSARLVSVAAALLLLTAGAPTASAGSTEAAVSAPQRMGDAQLRFNFDNGESLRPGTRVRNVSGLGAGRVLVAGGGRLLRVQGITRHGAKFPAACRGCGRAIIEAPDRAALDPRRSDFTFSAAVRMAPREGRHRSNIVQKGYFRQPGGQYKLQIDFGRPSCVVRGGAGRVFARSTVNLADRRWHTVTCHRWGSAVLLRVDGKVRARVRGATGWLANESPVRIGGKKVTSGPNDQYRGRLDNVFVRIRSAR